MWFKKHAQRLFSSTAKGVAMFVVMVSFTPQVRHKKHGPKLSSAWEALYAHSPNHRDYKASPSSAIPDAHGVLYLPSLAWLLSILMAKGIQLPSTNPETSSFKSHSFAPGSFSTLDPSLWTKCLAHLIVTSLPSWRYGILFLFLNIKAPIYSIFQ